MSNTTSISIVMVVKMGAKNGSINGDIYDVFVYPLDEHTVGALKAAKADMDVEYQIVPKAAQIGTQGRVIAFWYPPWIVADGYADVTEATLDGLRAAIHWAATGQFDSRVSTAEQQLSKIFGKPVTEISKDQLAFEGASRALDLDNKKKVRFGK